MAMLNNQRVVIFSNLTFQETFFSITLGFPRSLALAPSVACWRPTMATARWCRLFRRRAMALGGPSWWGIPGWKIMENHGTIMEHMENLYKNHGTYRKNMVKSWKTYGQQTIENIFFSANSWKIMENMENDGKNVWTTSVSLGIFKMKHLLNLWNNLLDG